jgi:hypothetical protein
MQIIINTLGAINDQDLAFIQNKETLLYIKKLCLFEKTRPASYLKQIEHSDKELIAIL